ncbi:MBL fold metallo-hydrolase [Bacillus sp. JCM 19034]|uniref:MBL fold metallo-hydrolase n=1 Tax=Bacillus sp. JCM 19034 TaxID=1481928 RepID=UPI0007866B9A|nr:MBL fold metallo-hydrolase [Bacillus sp. JCM 19034]
MKWTQIPLGPLQTNAYVIQNDEHEAIIIDPGGDGPQLVEWLKQESLQPLAILLTHAHFDHIGAVDDVRRAFSCPTHIHHLEGHWLGDSTLNGSQRFMSDNPIVIQDADFLINSEKSLTIHSFTFEILETPGHSPGSVSYYMKDESIIFSGDVLFEQSIGRTDLPGGNHEQLLKSIHTKLLDLPEETVVACGHGRPTTIGQEMDHNPFLSGF